MKRVMITTGVIAMTLASSPAIAEGPVASASAAPSASAPPAPTAPAPTAAAPTAAAPSATAPPAAATSTAAPVATHIAPTPARPPVVASAASAPPPVVPPPATVAATPAPAPAPAPPLSASAAPPAPSLPTRETKLQLATEPPSSSWGYKLAFVAVIIAGGVVAWKKRKGTLGLSLAAKDDGLRVRARAPLGMRAEVAVIEVGGMRVLVGVTASSVQTLAMLDPEDETATAAEPSQRPAIDMLAPRPRASIDDRARNLFGEPEANARGAGRQAAARYADVDAIPKRTARRPKTAGAKIGDGARDEGPLEGQARGITLALGPKP